VVLLPACSKSLWGTVSLIPVEKKENKDLNAKSVFATAMFQVPIEKLAIV
jgi:hypothetical protein